MKLLFLCLCSLFLSVPVWAQRLSFKNLLKFREMEPVTINQKLSKKGWQFMSDEKPTAGMMGKAVWAFQPSGEEATAWCVLYYSDRSPSSILYNLYGGTAINAINKIHRKVRRRSMEVLEEGHQVDRVEFLQSYADYADDRYVMRLLNYQQPGYYGIKIFSRSDYLKAKRNHRL
ncbi:hypothetical protein I2I11_21020 [Pontibacter sp. 172403-2]|uniref:hypothetical protein n=1 Tax=Pontibacter rufus TaxID=2791028 RepID=UPI0018AFE896|nr:hypothetical protein [Pontibacter sp. 172403-2]MBF9255794.1 hypothetical protein [Pontibacter sp. 172403-2]